ncbi:MAG: metallophosphoesterase [Candidatus Omnitrophica bacterium]|nr:metallophosphoesterase [Candidatus Omnitrophota bacterium]
MTTRTPVSFITLVSFIITSLIGPLPLAFAQEYHLPAPGVMVHLSPPINSPILKGIKVHLDDPFKFDFILDKGDSELSNAQLKDESTKLIKYFLASITIPEKDLWVNLSPYEKDRIIPQSFSLTEMGRDLLGEDYILKQITASLIYPEDEIGKKFWKRIYEEAQKKYGTTNIPVNTFNKVWIIPEKAVVYENAKAGAAYVVESKLKVMLEQDYLSLAKHEGIQSGQTQSKETSQLGSQIVREIVIPQLTTEVNENKNFVRLRQVYNSLILAAWYKKKIKDSILAQVYADKNKVAGVNIDDPKEKEKIYHEYLRAFKKGVYNYIKEDIDPVTKETIPRKYFSGGVQFDGLVTLERQRFGNTEGVLELNKTMPQGVNLDEQKSVLVSANIDAFKGQVHENRNNEIRGILEGIAQDLGIAPDINGEFNFRGRVLQAPGHRVNLGNLEIRIDEDGVLLFVGERFKGKDHAGIQRKVVFAEDEGKVRHEKAELVEINKFIDEINVKGKIDLSKGRGVGLRAWVNGKNVNGRVMVDQQIILDRQNRLRAAAQEWHNQGLRAEGGRDNEINNVAVQKFDDVQNIIEGFDFNIAGDGNDQAQISAQAVKEHLMRIQESGDQTVLIRTIKLLSAVLGNPEFLNKKGAVPDRKEIKDMIKELDKRGGIAVADLQSITPTGNDARSKSYQETTAALVGLAEGEGQAFSEGKQHETAEINVNELQGPELKEMLENRVKNLERLRDKIQNGELPDVIMFGDKHGDASDLKRIVAKAVSFARRNKGQPNKKLKIIGHGDGFDRGEQNVEVFQLMKQLKQIEAQNPDLIEVHLLWGNHDAFLFEGNMLGDERARLIWWQNGGKKAKEEFERKGVDINELARFMLENFELFHIDEWGVLHVHAGIPMDDQGNPKINRQRLDELQGQLNEIQAQFKQNPAFLDNTKNRQKVGRFFKNEDVHNLFWVRGEDWYDKFKNEEGNIRIDDANKERLFNALAPMFEKMLRKKGRNFSPEDVQNMILKHWKEVLITAKDDLKKAGINFEIVDSPVNENKLNNFLLHLGVNRVVFGHVHHGVNLNNVILGIDVDEQDAGHFIVNQEGIQFNPVARSQVETLLPMNNILRNLSSEIGNLRERLGAPKQAEEAKPVELKEKPPSVPLIAKSNEQELSRVSYSKARMNKYGYQLGVVWAKGQFDMKLRSSEGNGSLELYDIKVAGKKLGGVLVKMAGGYQRTNGLVINQEETLEIGRLEDGQYLFVVGEKVYAVGVDRDSGKSYLIENGPLDRSKFSPSRTIENNKDAVEVVSHPGATTLTVVNPLVDVDNEQQFNQMVAAFVEEFGYDLDEQLEEQNGGIEQKKILGGERQGGQMEVSFSGNVWVSAGRFAYRVWGENDIVKLRRYDRKNGSSLGKEREVPLNKEFTVGRTSGDYQISGDTILSSQHFSLAVTVDEKGQSKIRLTDLQSKGGTKVEWEQPTAKAVDNVEMPTKQADNVPGALNILTPDVKRIIRASLLNYTDPLKGREKAREIIRSNEDIQLTPEEVGRYLKLSQREDYIYAAYGGFNINRELLTKLESDEVKKALEALLPKNDVLTDVKLLIRAALAYYDDPYSLAVDAKVKRIMANVNNENTKLTPEEVSKYLNIGKAGYGEGEYNAIYRKFNQLGIDQELINKLKSSEVKKALDSFKDAAMFGAKNNSGILLSSVLSAAVMSGVGGMASINPFAELENARFVPHQENVNLNRKSREKLEKGGVDLNAVNDNLQVKNSGEEIKFHLNPAQLAQLQNASGFTPVIIDIQPMTNIKLFLGLTNTDDKVVNV